MVEITTGAETNGVTINKDSPGYKLFQAIRGTHTGHDLPEGKLRFSIPLEQDGVLHAKFELTYADNGKLTTREDLEKKVEGGVECFVSIGIYL